MTGLDSRILSRFADIQRRIESASTCERTDDLFQDDIDRIESMVKEIKELCRERVTARPIQKEDMAYFGLQNRYQDSGWGNLPDQRYYREQDAIKAAAGLSCDAICYGMVRVVDLSKGIVIKTFPAGGNSP